MKALLTAAAVLGLACCCAEKSMARDTTWTGGASDGKWETAGNWADGPPPVNGDAIILSATADSSSRNGTPNLLLAGITFSANSAACAVNGKPIKLHGDISNLGSTPQVLNLYITLTKNIVISTTGDLSLGGVVRGEKFGIDKIGPGQLTLTGMSDFKGPTIIHSGTLVLGNDKALNVASLIALDGGKLAMTNNISPSLGTLKVASASILDFGTGTGSHTVTFADSKAQPWTGTLAIYNWDGDATAANSLVFGTDNTALTAAQLKAITFYRDGAKMLLGTGAWSSKNGQVTFAK